MDPVLTVLRFGEVERTLGTYGALLSAAILVAAILATRAAARAGMDVGATIAACGFTAGGGLAGAYGLFVLVEWVRTGDPSAAIENGGLVFYGSPIGGFLALWLACKKLGLDLGRLLDVGIAAIPAGHAIGRLGCFFGGCCYGLAWDGPWAVRYTHPIAPAAYPPILRHPTPLYESALLLLLAWAFVLFPARRVGHGGRAGVYLVAYAIIRTTTELFRGDTVRGVFFGGAISPSQLISLLLFTIGVAVIAQARYRDRLAAPSLGAPLPAGGDAR